MDNQVNHHLTLIKSSDSRHSAAAPTGVETAAPEPVISDYVQVTYLTMFFLLGAPINLAAYVDLKQNQPNIARCRMTKIQTLKRHLNLSDLMVILVYTPSQIIWLLTYSWYGGDTLCKLVKFLHNLSFQISSNVIVCIALDRLMSIFPASSNFLTNSSTASWIRKNRTQLLLVIAWISAILLSCPLLVTYTVFAPFENFEQCVTIWQKANFFKLTSNETLADLNVKNSAFDKLELIYGAFNLLCVFWIPLAIVALCYFTIFLILKRKSYSTQREESSTKIYKSTKNTNKPPPSQEFPLKEIQKSKNSRQIPEESRKSQKLGSSFFENETVLVGAEQQKARATHELEPMFPQRVTHISSSGTVGSRSSESREDEPDDRRHYPRRSIRQDSVVVYDGRRQQRSAMRISVALVIAYAVCWLPYNILSLWEFFHRESYVNYSETLDFVHGLVVLNSVVNPFIYGMFGRYPR